MLLFRRYYLPDLNLDVNRRRLLISSNDSLPKWYCYHHRHFICELRQEPVIAKVLTHLIESLGSGSVNMLLWLRQFKVMR